MRDNSVMQYLESTYLMGSIKEFGVDYDTEILPFSTSSDLVYAIVQLKVPYKNLCTMLDFLSCLNVADSIKKVIFNGPATIVLWNDGTKTVVKCSAGDTFSKEAGLSLCILKKLSGDNFHKTIRKWCKEKE